MSPAAKALNLDGLTVDERIALVTEIWDAIVAGAGPGLLTDARRAELRGRVADHDANPDDVVSWDEAKAAALRRVGK